MRRHSSLWAEKCVGIRHLGLRSASTFVAPEKCADDAPNCDAEMAKMRFWRRGAPELQPETKEEEDEEEEEKEEKEKKEDLLI